MELGNHVGIVIGRRGAAHHRHAKGDGDQDARRSLVGPEGAADRGRHVEANCQREEEGSTSTLEAVVAEPALVAVPWAVAVAAEEEEEAFPATMALLLVCFNKKSF